MNLKIKLPKIKQATKKMNWKKLNYNQVYKILNQILIITIKKKLKNNQSNY